MTFDKSFSVYHDSDKRRLYPVEWIYSDVYSNDERVVFQAYDANLFPLPDIKDWNPVAIDEICKKVSERFKHCQKEIYLDGYLLNLKEGTLADNRLDE